MPTAGGFDHLSGFNHPTDADFLALEDIVYGFTRRLHDNDSDDDGSADGNNTWLRCRQNSSLKCPVCKADHPYAAPSNDRVPEENRYSHDCRVIYASFGCPICLDDPAGPPMVVLPCGHAVCQNDFRLLGGKTTDAEADAQARQAANEETQQHRESINRNRNQPSASNRRIPPFLRAGRDDMDQITMAMMHAFASSLNEAMESTGAGNVNNNAHDDEDEESTDSEMPELIRPPVTSFDSSDDDMPQLRARQRGNRRNDGNAPALVPPSRLLGNPLAHLHTGQTPSMFPAIEMLGYGGVPRNRPRITGTGSDDDDDDDDSSYLEGEGYDEDNEDSEYQDPDEVIWRLGEYHPGNAVLSDPPAHPGFPKLGQWLLVPEVADNNKTNLMYYCEYAEENNLFVAKQFPRGTRMIQNGRHGVYVHTPRHFTGSRRQWPRRNAPWELLYVKNSNPASNVRSSRSGRRQESAQIFSTTISNPVFRYKIQKSAQLVADGKGGIWALCQTSSMPETLVSQIEAPEENNNNNQGAASSETDSNMRRQNDPRLQECRLVHYTRQERDGKLVGGVFNSNCKLFMDQSGGVFLLQPNIESVSSSSSSFSSLWHILDQNNNPQTLLYGGLPSDTKVVGDSTGASVFLLSSGGRLRSILTRVMVERSDPTTATEDTPAVRSVACFSYDLDFSIDAIQDIVDVPEGDMKQVFLHARMHNPDRTHPSQRIQWRLCRVTPATEATSGRDANVVSLNVDCPRTSRVVSDRESGVWVWKKPTYHMSPGDRCFVHVHASGEEHQEWDSPCVFPPRTHLAALG